MQNTIFESLYHLFFGKPFNFYSPYTLEEAHQHLQNTSERDKRKPSLWRVIWGILSRQQRHFLLITVDSINLQSYGFRADS